MKVWIDDPRARVTEHTDGIIEVALQGDIEDADVDEFFDQFQPVMEELAPLRFLIDASGLGESSLSARWKLANRMKSNRRLIERSAVIGVSSQIQVVFRVILRASGRNNVKVCNSRAEALDYLRKNAPE